MYWYESIPVLGKSCCETTNTTYENAEYYAEVVRLRSQVGGDVPCIPKERNMATYKVTGKLWEEICNMEAEWDADEKGKPFHDAYCLAKIPKQPPEYDGPPRFCVKQGTLKRIGSKKICKFHGGAGSLNTDNLETLGAMKHGMTATREHLVQDFDEKDKALYDWVIDHFPEAYGIDVEEDPAAAYDIHRLAAEIVRAERGRGFLLDEGEVHEKEVRNDEGRVIIGDDGKVVTEKSEHYLAKMIDRQDRKITSLEKELLVTRKERERQDSTDSAVEAIKNFSQLGQQFLGRDENEYDPENKPWEEDE